MGKGRKNKNNESCPLQSKESFERMNFLYQASQLMLSCNPGKPDIAAYYANVMKNIAQKSVLQIEPAIKRTLCKRCSSILVPGVTARVRLRNKSSQRLIWFCLRCNTVKRFNTVRDYKMWCERPEAVVKTTRFNELSGKGKEENVQVAECSKALDGCNLIEMSSQTIEAEPVAVVHKDCEFSTDDCQVSGAVYSKAVYDFEDGSSNLVEMTEAS